MEIPGQTTGFPDPELDVPADENGEQSAVLAGGCFWCVEAVLRQLDGVLDVTSGYAGGTAETADYRAVCSGATDHAEVVRVRFDAGRISFGQLLKVFFAVAHDPTQLDRQVADVGRQYRSSIFYSTDRQREVASAYINQLNDAGMFRSPLATRLEPLDTFYPAEDYHQDYAALNPGQPYIACTVPPKLDKLQQAFGERLKNK